MTITFSSFAAFPSSSPDYQQQQPMSSSKAFQNLQISLPSTNNLLDSQQEEENSNQLSTLLELNPSPVPSLMKHSPTNSSSCSLWSAENEDNFDEDNNNFADQLFPALPEQDEDWLQFGWLLDGGQLWREEQQQQKKTPEEMDDKRWDKEEKERNSSPSSSATTEAGLLSSAATCGSTNSSSNGQNASETDGEMFFGGSSTCTIITGISSAAFGKTTEENAPAEAQEQPIAMRTRSHPNPKNNSEQHQQKQNADDERQEEEDASLNWTLDDDSLQEQQQSCEDLLWKWLADVQKRRRAHKVRRNNKQRKTAFSKAFLLENVPKRKRQWHEIAGGRHGIKKRKCHYTKQWPKAESPDASAESHCPQCQQSIPPKELVPNGTEMEEEMEEEELFCTCKQPYNEFSFYVGCDRCNGWFHPECIGTTQEHILAIEGQPFFCPNCRSP